MSIIKSFSVGDGDMFFIKHNSSNFSIIDSCMDETNEENIIDEIETEQEGKAIVRFISTHPDNDHLRGLRCLDDNLQLMNFYCVENKAIKDDWDPDFDHYCKLRDGEHHFYVKKGCRRKWMNENDPNDGKNYGSSGIDFLWPDLDNLDYKEALAAANRGESFNNISPIFRYSLEHGVRIIWMGDMETDFQEKIIDEVQWPSIDILFAPHHGRESGRVPSEILKKLDPKIIVIGEAPSKHLNYYQNYNTIKQNSAGDIVFDCLQGKVRVFVSNENYQEEFLKKETIGKSLHGHYLGTIHTKDQ